MTVPTVAATNSSKPQSLHFPLQENEQVLMICRRHWLYFYPRLLLLLLEAAVPLAVLAVILGKLDALHGSGAKIFAAVTLIWLGYSSLRVFLAWFKYANDIWVITDQRIIDSLKTSPFSLKLSTADLVNVLDMTVVRKGIFQTAFDFGDIICQTAADLQEFRLVGIPHPREVQALVDRERDRERLRAAAGSATKRLAEL